MTDKYGPKISAVTFYRHRFKKALQILNSTNGDPLEAYAKLKQQLNASNKKIGGSAILFIVLSSALIASMPEGSLKIKTAFASFSVPTVYLLFGASVIWFTLCMSLLSTCQILTFLSTFRQFFGRYKNDYEWVSLAFTEASTFRARWSVSFLAATR
ncbi:hypothetical protein ACROSR_14045, partial [Roseovarius tibetensis]|uniref:hypothetical protein n=1 Tax=Roseovarius tibetensis TaxID=2685897 RepID=UPI003D7FE715